MQTDIDRYSRQSTLSLIGTQGQRRLQASTVLVAGCGALGTVTATQLVRAGVGRVRIVDREFVENHNLQRQVLFVERDVEEQIPKALAAAKHLHAVNSSVEIDGIVEDINYTNIRKVLDCSQNVEQAREITTPKGDTILAVACTL